MWVEGLESGESDVDVVVSKEGKMDVVKRR